MNPDTARTAFRAVAIAEAVSWVGLLTGMFLKYVANASHEGGVPVFGMIHGLIFLTYVAMCFVARRSFGWSHRTALLALASSIPPFFTYVFEVQADRRGLLDQATSAAPSPR